MHAAAKRVHLSARPLGAVIEVRIADDGRGFDLTNALRADGRGLRNLRRRAVNLQAGFDIVTEVGNGTAIRLLLPVVRGQTVEGVKPAAGAVLASTSTADCRVSANR